jgi:hypothetical protein
MTALHPALLDALQHPQEAQPQQRHMDPLLGEEVGVVGGDLAQGSHQLLQLGLLQLAGDCVAVGQCRAGSIQPPNAALLQPQSLLLPFSLVRPGVHAEGELPGLVSRPPAGPPRPS